MNIFARTCQECGHIQQDVQPIGKPTMAYDMRECKKCKSEALDYGHNAFVKNEQDKICIK